MYRKGQTSVLLLSTLSMITSFAAWSVFSPMAGEMQDTYQLSTTEKSILVAAPVLLGSLMRIPMGILTDRYGGKKVFTLTMLFLLLPLFGASMEGQSYASLLFWAVLIGMAGTTFAVSITFVSKWFPPEKQGLILGIAGMGNLGSAIAGFSVPMIVSQLGTAWVFRIFACAIGLMALIFWIGTEEPTESKKKKSLKDSLSVLKFKQTWVLSLYYVLSFGGFVTFSVYLPVLFQDLHGLSAFEAGLKTAIFVVGATCVRPIGGYLSDQYGTKKVLSVVFTGILACALLMAVVLEDAALFYLCCLVISVMLGTGNGAVFKLVPQVSLGNTGAVTGIVGAIGGIGGFFPPILLGIIKDISGTYTLGFILLALFAVVCLVMNSEKLKKLNRRSVLKKAS